MINLEPVDAAQIKSEPIRKEELKKFELSPAEKLSKVQKVLSIISGVKSLLVSGSLAQQIIQHAKNGECELGAENVAGIHDIDLAVDLSQADSSPTATLEKLAPLNSLIFEIEQNMAQYSCLGAPQFRNMVVQQAKVAIEGDTFDVLYTTPEFLLLTCVGGGITPKTPAEKYERKIREIPLLPGFSGEKFTALAQYETAAKPELIEAKRINEFITVQSKNS